MVVVTLTQALSKGVALSFAFFQRKITVVLFGFRRALGAEVTDDFDIRMMATLLCS